MLRQLGEFDRTFSMLDELRRRMDRMWEDWDADEPGFSTQLSSAQAWPRVNVFDTGSNLVLKADVPGVNEKDLHISINQGALSISGERKHDAPQGYAVHRLERGAVNFSRAFSLPIPVDADKTTATIKDGVLTITLAKAPEAQPRKIGVQTR
ncbi:MAG TPA: Hsp20/alpha crystallin family protein [Polyangiaceae bacterium]|nr:Hsp20/alpha crystallin family protein [Polyangiaceae bacterium]